MVLFLFGSDKRLDKKHKLVCLDFARLVAVVFFLLTVGFSTDSLFGQNNSAPLFLDGLRERRLYQLVDRFCQDRWADANLSDRALAELTASWLRASTQRALESSPQERPKRWQQVDKIAAAYRARAAGNPSGLLVSIQFALSVSARAELAREEAEFLPGRKLKLEQAISGFRSAIVQLQAAETVADALLRKSYQHAPSKTDASAWTVAQLESWKRHLHVELARAFRQQALCYGPSSPDRINALSQALEKLQPIVAQPIEEALLWQSRVEQLVCLRLLNRYDDARRQLARWKDASPPPNLQARLVGEQLRLDMAEGLLDRALSTARKIASDKISPRAPETDIAILNILLTAIAKKNPQEAMQLRREAANTANEIAIHHGPYWKRRADAILGQVLAKTPNTNNPELLVRAASSLYTEGRWQEAIAAYDAASQRFSPTNRTEQHIKAAATAAAIVRQTGDLSEALKKFRQLALKMPHHPRAPELHLTAAGLAADLARDAPRLQQAVATERFTQLLHEHLQHWPKSSQADTARWWSARQWISRRDWPAAIEMLSAIDPASKHFSEIQAPWKSRTGALLAATKIGQGKIEEGKQILRSVLSSDGSAPEDLLIFMEALQLGTEPHRKPQLEIAQVVVECASWVEGSSQWESNSAEAAGLAKHLGLAYRHLGNRKQALTAYQRWSELHPQEGDAHEAYAVLLGQGSNSKELRKALAVWQQVERRSQAGGPRWSRARKSRLRLLVRLNQPEQAEKLRRLTLVLYPQFGGK